MNNAVAKSCCVPLSLDFHTDKETHQLLIAAITEPQMDYFWNQHGINRLQKGPEERLSLFSKAPALQMEPQGAANTCLLIDWYL